MEEARQLFEDAARAARRLEVVRAELEAVDEAWRRGEWLGTGASRVGRSDPTAARAVARLNRRQTLEDERAELERVVAEAVALVDGVGALLGQGYADALRLRYVEGKTWAQVAEVLGTSERTPFNRARVAFDTIDGLGAARVRRAQGIAAA